jgi:hypothetical protein
METQTLEKSNPMNDSVDSVNSEPASLDASEYETASEWDPDFHSDNEPPADKVYEERLVIKRKDVRLYKKIVKLGKRGDMPSKYNKVSYRFVRHEKETLDTEKLSQ